MIAESVDFAFEDMNERIWTEAKLKAEELLPAVDAALAQLGDAISAEESATVSSSTPPRSAVCSTHPITTPKPSKPPPSCLMTPRNRSPCC
jgi:hypothetical protein